MKVTTPAAQKLLRPISIVQILLIVACGLVLAELIELVLGLEHVGTLKPGWLAHYAGEIGTLALVFAVLFRPMQRRSRQRQELINALQISEDQYRTLVEGLDVGVALIDENFQMVRSNRVMERFQGGHGCRGSMLKCYELLLHSGGDICASCPVEQTLTAQRPATTEMHLPDDVDSEVKDIRVRTFPVDTAVGGRQFIEVVEDITAEVRSKAEIQRLSRELNLAAEEERKRLAHDLHDQCGQVLAGVQYNLAALSAEVAATLPELGGQFNHISAMVEQIGDNIRQVSTRLRPSALDDLGLVATLNWLADDFRRQCPTVELSLSAADVPEQLASDIETSIFRICQESLNNVIKHSGATRVEVTLAREQENILLEIVDNGRGFSLDDAMSLAALQGRLGLRGMRERVKVLGGRLNVEASPGNGVRIEARVPVAAEVGHG